MSINIGPAAPAGVGQVPSSASRTRAPTSTAGATSDDSVRVDTLAGSPPPEVHQAMAAASNAYEKLHAAGHQLSFQIDDRTGKVRVEVHDLNGRVLFAVPPSKALQIAADGVIN